MFFYTLTHLSRVFNLHHYPDILKSRLHIYPDTLKACTFITTLTHWSHVFLSIPLWCFIGFTCDLRHL